jgi:7-carboxy-7-deazaguanine synthase
MRIRYSEIFFSFQGEALHAGRPAAWVRFFGCNLNCNGFGQKDPTDPSTYILPHQQFDVEGIEDVNNLPVWKYGCDSSYSWSAKYKHLAKDGSPSDIADRIEDSIRSASNPDGLFIHPITQQPYMLCFTGGEPMLQQDAMVAILQELKARDNLPTMVTVETNGTRPIGDALLKFIYEYRMVHFNDWHWAISPKLFNVSGEQSGIRPTIVRGYVSKGSSAVLKFVCNGTEACWDELDAAVKSIFLDHVWAKPEVWVMPVGATVESQSENTVADIAIEAMQRGYNVATRNHVYVWGNAIGR